MQTGTHGGEVRNGVGGREGRSLVRGVLGVGCGLVKPT